MAFLQGVGIKKKKKKSTVHNAAPPTCSCLAPKLMTENRTCNTVSCCDNGEGNTSTDCNFMIFILIKMTEGRHDTELFYSG